MPRTPNFDATDEENLMKTAVALFAVLAFICGGTVSVAQAAEPARDLPTAYEAELKAAKKIRFGQRAALASECVKRKRFTCTKYKPVVVTVRSMTPGTREGWPEGTPTFNLDVTIENRTSSSGGLLPALRCANVEGDGSFYFDSVETQSIPAMSRQDGGVIVSLPDIDSESNIAVKPSECENAVIWLRPVSYFDLSKKEAKKAKMSGAAYIPLAPDFLATLPEVAPASAE